MIQEAMFSGVIRILEKSAQLRMVRQGYLASNIANAETPNYRAIDIDFMATMEQVLSNPAVPTPALRKEELGHFSLDGSRGAGGKRIVFADSGSYPIGNDSNSVNLESEMAKMQENSLLFAATTQILAKKLKGLSNIIDSTSRY